MPINLTHKFIITAAPGLIDEILPSIESYLKVIEFIDDRKIVGKFSSSDKASVEEYLKYVANAFIEVSEILQENEVVEMAGAVNFNAENEDGEEEECENEENEGEENEEGRNEGCICTRILNGRDNRIPDSSDFNICFDEIKNYNTQHELDTLIRTYNIQLSHLISCQNRIYKLTSKYNKDKILEGLESIKTMIDHGAGKIDKVWIRNGRINLLTKTIVSNPLPNGKRKLIGRIIIAIDIQTLVTGDSGNDNSPILFYNVDRTISIGNRMHDAPHVVDAFPCFGNIYEAIISSAAKGELLHVVDLSIRYLESVNMEDGWGHSIIYWPDYEEVNVVS